MEPFTTLTAIAAPMPMQNIDTDKVIPGTLSQDHQALGPRRASVRFPALRQGRQGTAGVRAEPGALPQGADHHRARELRLRFSSREHAPWALLDFGIRCIIAPDFADIFFNNSFKNGILPVRLPRAVCDQLIDDAKLGGNARITVDLARQVVVRPSGEEIHFDVDPFRKHLLLNGLDDIGQTLQHAPKIDTFEAGAAAEPAVDTRRPPPREL